MNIYSATFYLILLLSSTPQSESHRKHLLQFSPVPDASISFIPTASPSEIPSNSPLPSPNPPASSPSPVLPSPFPTWCVAKPTAPADQLQEAMDYACGTGRADCKEIRPGGACFYPDTVMAHSSFAFNSYWQREKNHGGNCDFGGAAIVVSSDPSFQGCHFELD